MANVPKEALLKEAKEWLTTARIVPLTKEHAWSTSLIARLVSALEDEMQIVRNAIERGNRDAR